MFGFDLKEFERFLGVAILVARLVFTAQIGGDSGIDARMCWRLAASAASRPARGDMGRAVPAIRAGMIKWRIGGNPLCVVVREI